MLVFLKTNNTNKSIISLRETVTRKRISQRYTIRIYTEFNSGLLVKFAICIINLKVVLIEDEKIFI